jgi:hypothetical protein
MEPDSLRSRVGIVAGSLLFGVVVGYLLGRDGEDEPSPTELDTPELVAELQAKHAVFGGLLDELSERIESGLEGEFAGEMSQFLEEGPDSALDFEITEDLTDDEEATEIDFEIEEDEIDLDDDDEIGI